MARLRQRWASLAVFPSLIRRARVIGSRRVRINVIVWSARLSCRSPPAVDPVPVGQA